MGYDLRNGRDEFHFSIGSWPYYLCLAEQYGWSPAGTLPPDGFEPQDWKGDYYSTDGQYVAADDAERLATALQAVVDEIENFEQMIGIGHPNTPILWQSKDPISIRLGPDIPFLKRMIAFFRAGRFRIL